MNSNSGSNQPISGDFQSWNAYWTAQGQPWRTEPEIDEDRKRYLAQQRTIKPNVSRGIYPFKGVELTRADVEWLLATHESAGMVGPVDWDDPAQRKRTGLDLRGTTLHGVDLRSLPLSRLQGGIGGRAFFETPESVRVLAAVDMSDTLLSFSRLEGSTLAHARLNGAALEEARFEKSDLYGAHFEAQHPANLRDTVFDANTTLARATLATDDGIGPRLNAVRWGGATLTAINWSSVRLLYDEQEARSSRNADGTRKSRNARIRDFDRAVQAYRQLTMALHSQGLNEEADRFSYRARVMERRLLWREAKLGRYLFSWFLAALAGYGYRLERIFITYVLTLSAFAFAYCIIGLPNEHALPILQRVADAYQLSLIAIHGRVFFEQLGLGSTLAWITSGESVCGIIIEAVFTSMLVQRFFAR